MHRIPFTFGLALFGAACGGAGDATPPIQALPAPTVAAAPETPPAPPKVPVPPTAVAKASMADLQKTLLGSTIDAFNAHDANKAASTYTDEAILRVAGMPDVTGKDAIQKDAVAWMTAFPNAKFGVSRAWGKGDVLISEWVLTGTHSSELLGVKATEKPVGIAGLTVSWVTPDGKIKEEHRYFDAMTMVAQMGAGPKGMKTRAIPSVPTSTEWHWAKGLDRRRQN